MDKTCSTCKACKPLGDFNRDKNKSMGVNSQCRECQKKRGAQYRKSKSHISRDYFRKPEKVAKDLLNKAKQRSKKKNVPFNLKEEDIPAPPSICPVLGIPIYRSEGHSTDNSPSMDRIIPDKGYVVGNIRIISERANRLKNNATAAEMLLIYQDLKKIEETNEESLH